MIAVEDWYLWYILNPASNVYLNLAVISFCYIAGMVVAAKGLVWLRLKINGNVLRVAMITLAEARNFKDEANVDRIFYIRGLIKRDRVRYSELNTTPEELSYLEALGHEAEARDILEKSRNGKSSSFAIKSLLEKEHFDLSRVGSSKIEVAALLTRAMFKETL